MNVGSAANAAVRAADLQRRGQQPSAIWRQTVLELLDVYESWYRRGATDAAASLFSEAPPPSGIPLIDSALAAFAEHLALRDHWPVPEWAVEQPPEYGHGRRRKGRHARWSDEEFDSELGLGIDVA